MTCEVVRMSGVTAGLPGAVRRAGRVRFRRVHLPTPPGQEKAG